MFKGLGNLGNIGAMMGALQNLPQKIEELKQRMKSEFVTGSSSCSMVTVSMNGAGEVQSIEIDPSLTGNGLSEAVMDATNAAGKQAKELFASAISEMTSDMDLNIPGMDGILSSFTGAN